MSDRLSIVRWRGHAVKTVEMWNKRGDLWTVGGEVWTVGVEVWTVGVDVWTKTLGMSVGGGRI